MSPSEKDLRAALRDGEGDHAPDVDDVIAHARAHRSQRRARVLSVAAAVVVVAAAGVGGAALWGGSDGDGRQGAGTPLASTSASPGSSATRNATPGTTAPTCPAGYPARSFPSGGLTSGAGGPMFASPIDSVVVCSYSATGTSSTGPASVTLTGSDASALADSIESASKAQLHVVCPDIVTAQKTRLAIIARTAGGTVLPTVTTDVSVPNCNQPITNGTAVRYAWKPPAAVAARITNLTRVQPAGGGAIKGSPVR